MLSESSEKSLKPSNLAFSSLRSNILSIFFCCHISPMMLFEFEQDKDLSFSLLGQYFKKWCCTCVI